MDCFRLEDGCVLLGPSVVRVFFCHGRVPLLLHLQQIHVQGSQMNYRLLLIFPTNFAFGRVLAVTSIKVHLQQIHVQGSQMNYRLLLTFPTNFAFGRVLAVTSIKVIFEEKSYGNELP